MTMIIIITCQTGNEIMWKLWHDFNSEMIVIIKIHRYPWKYLELHLTDRNEMYNLSATIFSCEPWESDTNFLAICRFGHSKYKITQFIFAIDKRFVGVEAKIEAKMNCRIFDIFDLAGIPCKVQNNLPYVCICARVCGGWFFLCKSYSCEMFISLYFISISISWRTTNEQMPQNNRIVLVDKLNMEHCTNPWHESILSKIAIFTYKKEHHKPPGSIHRSDMICEFSACFVFLVSFCCFVFYNNNHC